MLTKVLFAAAMMTAFLSAPRGAAAFDFNGPGEPLKFSEIKAPAVPAPVNAAPRTCKPFLLSVSVGGVQETVVIERACTPENAPVWALMVEVRGRWTAAVKVSSEKYPAEKTLIENRIKNMAVEGISREDADFIVMKTGPVLKAAALAAPAEKEKLLAEATEALKAQLARK